MTFIDALKELSDKIPTYLPSVKLEAQTRTSLVEPFLRALGYDTSNPSEVVPEYGANFAVHGSKQDNHVDYGILDADGTPRIVIEVKHHRIQLNNGYKQLASYFVATQAKLGILTNGLIYRIYTDLDRVNVLDLAPVLEIDLRSAPDALLSELKFLTKDEFDPAMIKSRGKDRRIVNGIKKVLREQLQEPVHEDLVRYFFRELNPGQTFTNKIKPIYQKYTHRALTQFIQDEIDLFLTKARSTNVSESLSEPILDSELEVNLGTTIETTDEELEAYAIVKMLLGSIIDADRLYLRDRLSYCNVLLDDNKNKPVCRFYFNGAQKAISVFDQPGETASEREDKILISAIDDVMGLRDRLHSSLATYT